MNASLHEVYAAADYCVQLPDGELILHIGKADAAADARLGAAGVCTHWAIVTPCNPVHRGIDAAANAADLVAFNHELQQCGARRLPAVNRDPTGRWPDEPGCLLLDPDQDQAERLGRHYGQRAIVRGRIGAAPQLVWL